MDITEPADTRELIEDAVEEGEKAEREKDRGFRDRVAILVGIFAVLLSIVHMLGAGAARESLAKGIESSNTFAYMEAKVVRETIQKVAAESALDPARRAAHAADAARLRAPDASGHGIKQLEGTGKRQAEEGRIASEAVEGYELGETALQLAIVLLSIALVARLPAIVFGACGFALVGAASAIAAYSGHALPWAG